MKKILLLFTLSAMLFAACKKDDEQSPSLVGTTWEQVSDDVSIKLTFQTKSDCQITISSPATTSAYVTNFTYEIEGSNVRMYPIQSGIAELKGLINGQTINVVNVSTGKTIYVLTKK